MRALRIANLSDDTSAIELADCPQPAPADGEVLVRVKLAPINPSDLNYVRGTYHDALSRVIWNQATTEPRYQPEGDTCVAPPYTIGGEAVGTVVSTGNGILAKRLAGKRVAVAGAPPNGTWADFVVVNAKKAVAIPDSVDDHQAASFFVNPLTAVALVENVLNVKKGHRVLITAAGSALADMLRTLIRLRGATAISVVRSDSAAAKLKSRGVESVVVATEDDLVDAVREIAPHGVDAVLDCVGGALLGAALRTLTLNGKIVCYGTLSGEAAELHPRDLMMPVSRVQGFYLLNWLASKSLLGRLRLVRRVTRLLAGGTLKTRVSETFAAGDYKAALEQATVSASVGKTYLTFD